MHELSIARSLVESVCEALPMSGAPAEAEGAGRVREVRIAVGRLSGVVAEALQFCYEIAAADTTLAGSVLVIDAVPIVVHCARCDVESTLADGARFRCAVCDAPTGDVRRGRELDIVSFTIDDAGAGGAADTGANAPSSRAVA